MSNINKQARDKLKSAAAKAVDNFDPNMFVETRDVLALLDELETAEKRIAELEAREVVLPPRAPENLAACLDGYDKWVIATTFRDTWNACLAEVVRVNAAVISTDSAIEELIAAGIITKVGE